MPTRHAMRTLPTSEFICDKSYLDEQGAFIAEWKEYVKSALDQGMTRDEAIARLTP